jgi:hypothetical protein
MSAAEAVRSALVADLVARAEFCGVEGLRRDTTPGALPQAHVEADVAGDWSTKDCEGRELRTAITMRVARGQAMRLPMMIAAAEAAGAVLSGDIDGWSVGSAVLVRSRSTDAPDGTRVATVEHRVRVLAS